MYNTPPREAVAGVAFLMFEISSTSLIDGVKGIRSCDTRVNTLLSSITVFMVSNHSGSISPSRTSHLYFWSFLYLFYALFWSRIITAITPSFHSLVLVFMQPYNSSDVTALGSTISHSVVWPLDSIVRHKFLQTADLAVPGTPIINTEWRTTRRS